MNSMKGSVCMNAILVSEELILQRKELRKEILFSFYEFNFKYGGSAKRTSIPISKDPEENAAYLYLIDSGLLFSEPLEGGYMAIKISHNGIDFIERGSNF